MAKRTIDVLRHERLEHVRKKYACASCERKGENPQIEVAAKAETAIEKGFAGPGLLAFIVTSKFADYLPLYRLEDIFERQGFEISRATQSVWCGDVADVVERLVAAIEPDEVVLGGGNVKKLNELPSGCRVGDNANAFLGGFRLWEDDDARKNFIRAEPRPGKRKRTQFGRRKETKESRI